MPNSPDAANGLAWTLLETGGSAREAARLAEQATTSRPIAPFFDTLARACLAAGRCGDAREAAEKAVAADSLSADYRSRLEEISRSCP
jgi:hypothetical protein